MARRISDALKSFLADSFVSNEPLGDVVIADRFLNSPTFAGEPTVPAADDWVASETVRLREVSKRDTSARLARKVKSTLDGYDGAPIFQPSWFSAEPKGKEVVSVFVFGSGQMETEVFDEKFNFPVDNFKLDVRSGSGSTLNAVGGFKCDPTIVPALSNYAGEIRFEGVMSFKPVKLTLFACRFDPTRCSADGLCEFVAGAGDGRALGSVMVEGKPYAINAAKSADDTGLIDARDARRLADERRQQEAIRRAQQRIDAESMERDRREREIRDAYTKDGRVTRVRYEVLSDQYGDEAVDSVEPKKPEVQTLPPNDKMRRKIHFDD